MISTQEHLSTLRSILNGDRKWLIERLEELKQEILIAEGIGTREFLKDLYTCYEGKLYGISYCIVQLDNVINVIDFSNNLYGDNNGK